MWAFKRQNTSSRLLTSQKANMPTVNPYDVYILHRPTSNKFKDPIDGDFSCFGETRTYARIATDEFPLRFSRVEVESGWCFSNRRLPASPFWAKVQEKPALLIWIVFWIPLNEPFKKNHDL